MSTYPVKRCYKVIFDSASAVKQCRRLLIPWPVSAIFKRSASLL